MHEHCWSCVDRAAGEYQLYIRNTDVWSCSLVSRAVPVSFSLLGIRRVVRGSIRPVESGTSGTSRHPAAGGRAPRMRRELALNFGCWGAGGTQHSRRDVRVGSRGSGRISGCQA